MATTIKCLAVDDHPAVRQGLALLLGGAPDIELVDAVHSGEEVMDAVRRHDPGVVIVDVRLPGMDGISTVKRLAADAPEANSVVFSAYGDKRLLSDAISAGARGYVMKGSPPDDLLRAIRTVHDGDAFVDPSLSPALLMTKEVADAPLSEREREVLQLLAEGLHTEEVARRIGLSPETVKSDTRRAITKLEADGRVHAVAIALRKALIE
jgi:DNA-binding NarL/FixJ family response regulator